MGVITPAKPGNESRATPADIQMRVKMGVAGRSPDIDQISVPSDLSEDLWGEVPKYEAIKNQEK